MQNRHSQRINWKLFFFIILIAVQNLTAQEKSQISLEDIWLKGKYFGEQAPEIRWMNNDQFFSELEYDEASESFKLFKYNIESGSRELLVDLKGIQLPGSNISLNPDNYVFSPDETKVLFEVETERIYRRSSKSDFYLYDLISKDLKKISKKGKISYPDFSPNGNHLAYVRDNNLYMLDLKSNQEKAITTTGEKNKIIHGNTDWVYEEEFEFAKAFFWSPDSKKIAYYTFDESLVKDYALQLWSGLYPENYVYKYPKAGEKNSEVAISVFDLSNNQIKSVDLGKEKDLYVPRIKWTANPNLLSVLKMNRKQNHLQLLHSNVLTGENKVVLDEKNNNYVEINDYLNYLKDGKRFVLSSEKSGFRHLFLYDYDGKLLKQITNGNWEVDNLLGVDEKNNLVYYTSTEESPLERYVYSISLDGKGKKQITKEKGTHEASASSGFKYLIDQYSTITNPGEIKLYSLPQGKVIKELASNERLKQSLANLNIKAPEFFQIPTDNGVKLFASMIKPANFDPSKKYPLLIYIYGGPGSQQVKNNWGGPNYLWFQMLAQKGYVVVTLDNRGTGGRGADFKKITQLQLGKFETEDLISAAKFLGGYNYIDKSRIGVFGWSFGGYMTSLAMTLGADYFKTGIAVAPVTSWRFYDTIYTERYLGLPQENPEGYDLYSPITHANKLKGNYLLIHGTADDNVHVQNAYEMQEALIKANKQFDIFYYPDKNHGIYGGNTRFHLYKKMTDYLVEKL